MTVDPARIRPFRRYLLWLFAFLLLLLLPVALLNLAVDPYRAYRLFDWPKLEDRRPWRSGRMVKAEDVRHHRYDVILLGSSHVEVGLDPTHPALGGNAYNFGLPAARFPELADAFNYLLRTNPPKSVLLMVDFFAFDDEEVARDEFSSSRLNPGFFSLDYHFNNLVGLDALQRSIRTLNNARRHIPSRYSPLGMRIAGIQPPRMTSREFFKFQLKILCQRDESRFHYSKSSLERLAAIARTCAKKGIRLDVVIPPNHAIDLEVHHARGSWPLFEQWKRDLTAAVNAAHSDSVSLWDFSGYSRYTAEPVPPPKSTASMKWHWEANHFRKELGDLVLSRIYAAGAPDFGVRLTPQNIDQHLAQDRTERQQFTPVLEPFAQFIQHQLAKPALASQSELP